MRESHMGEAMKLKHRLMQDLPVHLLCDKITLLSCFPLLEAGCGFQITCSVQSLAQLYLPEERINRVKCVLKNGLSPITTLIWPAKGYFAFKGCGYSCSFPTGEGLHTPNSPGLLQQVPRRDTVGFSRALTWLPQIQQQIPHCQM